MKPTGVHKFDFYMFNELYRHCLLQEGFIISFWRAANSLGDTGLFEVSLWHPLDNKSTRGHRASFGGKDDELGLCLHHYETITFKFLSYMFIFKEASVIVTFHLTSQMILSFSCASL